MEHRADPLSGAPARIAIAVLVGLALVALEILYFRWFFDEPLPNAARVGGEPIRRSYLLWQSLPGLIPDFPASRAILPLAAKELVHVENLPQRLPIVGAAALIAWAALGLGLLVLRGLRLHRDVTIAERLPLAFGLGTVGLGIVTLGLGRLGLLSPWPIRVALLLIGGWGIGVGGWGPLPRPRVPSPYWIVLAPFLIAMALGAMLPSYDYDAIEYHLQGPREYFEAGRIAFLPHNVYTSMPFGVEMLHLLGMEVVGDWWWGALVGQLMVMLFAPAAAAMVALTASRWGSTRAGWVAAVVYLTTPWVYRLAVIPYVEGPLCYFHAALVWAAGRAWDSSTPNRWGLVGLLAGGAMACKYPGLVSAVAPFGLVTLAASRRSRSWRPALAFAAGVAVAIGPWLARNVADSGNPVYPLGYRVFGGRHWDAQQDAKWWNAHGTPPATAKALADGLLDVAGRSDWQSPLYAALVPLALLRPGSRRLALVLTGYVAYIFATWFLLTHRLDRFWLPLLPAAAVLAGLGADWVRHWVWSIGLALVLAFGVASNLIYCSTSLAGFNEWTGDLTRLRHRVPWSLNEPLTKLDDTLPAGARILLVGQAAVFHVRHPVVYNTVFNKETIETLVKGRSPEQTARDLERLGIDYIYVDWREIERFRSPGNYGFTAFVTPAVFRGLVDAGILGPPTKLGLEQELYRVRRLADGAPK